MAKRRRLIPFDPDAIPPLRPLHPQGTSPRGSAQDTSSRPSGSGSSSRPSGPISDMAGAASAHAALDSLADEVSAARAGGRMIQALPLEQIDPDYLIRDRIAVDEDEMEALVESLRARGQQAPVEVVALPSSRFGLISGWRRFQALKRLHAETGEDRFATASALIRVPETAADAYLAMVEENEIRAGISFYERARLAVEAARLGVYADVATAISGLYGRASAPKRSKIASFVTLHAELGTRLRFGAAIPEKLGLALTGALKAEDAFGVRLRDALRRREAQNAAEERETLERFLRKAPAVSTGRTSQGEELAPGLFLKLSPGRATLSGPRLDAVALADLRDWLTARG